MDYSEGCDICNITKFTSKQTKELHFKGKAHEETLKEREEEAKPQPLQATESQPQQKEKGCALCKIAKLATDSVRIAHFEGKKHAQSLKREAAKEGKTNPGANSSIQPSQAAFNSSYVASSIASNGPVVASTLASSPPPLPTPPHPSNDASAASTFASSPPPLTSSDPSGEAVALPDSQEIGCAICGIAVYTSPQERQTHLAGKRHKAATAKRKSVPTIAPPTNQMFETWSESPKWSANDSDLIVSCVDKIVDVRAKPWEVRIEPLTVGLKASGHKIKDVDKVLREMTKGVTYSNREKMYSDEQLKKELRAKLRDEGTDEEGIMQTLESLAKRYIISTTDLGSVLAGSTAVKTAKEVASEPELFHLWRTVDAGQGDEENAFRKLWADATVVLNDGDAVGSQLRNSESRNVTDRHGDEGETVLEKALKEEGITPAGYRTENEQRLLEVNTEQSERCTIDILFVDPVIIKGHVVHWIEAKNKLLIPNVSSAKELRSYDSQVEKYVARYGTGAVLWTKVGFCETIISRNEKVFHFEIKEKTHDDEKKAKTTEKKKKKQKGSKTMPEADRDDLSFNALKEVVNMDSEMNTMGHGVGQELGGGDTDSAADNSEERKRAKRLEAAERRLIIQSTPAGTTPAPQSALSQAQLQQVTAESQQMLNKFQQKMMQQYGTGSQSQSQSQGQGQGQGAQMQAHDHGSESVVPVPPAPPPRVKKPLVIKSKEGDIVSFKSVQGAREKEAEEAKEKEEGSSANDQAAGFDSLKIVDAESDADKAKALAQQTAKSKLASDAQDAVAQNYARQEEQRRMMARLKEEKGRRLEEAAKAAKAEAKLASDAQDALAQNYAREEAQRRTMARSRTMASLKEVGGGGEGRLEGRRWW